MEFTPKSVRLAGFAAFADLCRHLQVSPMEARGLNPALRPPVFSGQKYVPKGYAFNLPAGQDAGHPVLAAVPATVFKTAQKPSRFYTVQRGDTAGKIARMHRVKLGDLILANGLDRRATVYVRQRLRIPQTGETIRPAVATQVAGRAATPERVAPAERIASVAFVLPDIPVESAERRYRRPGGSPAELLAMADDLTGANQLGPAKRSSVVQPGVVAADVGFEHVDQASGKPVGVIRVTVEETLGHYAEWAGVRASRIRHLNGLSFGQALQLHQRIKIPLGEVAAADFETRRYEYHKRLQEDFYTAYRVGELQAYRVRPGDSYWTLCREKFDLPLWLLKHYNADINLASLKVHQPLTIPSVESILDLPEPPAMSSTPDA